MTVALSGDGGDELFGGYNRYFLGARTWSRVSRVPRSLRRVMAHGALALSPPTWDRIAAAARTVTPERYHVHAAGDKVHKVAGALMCGDGAELYRRLVGQGWHEPVVLDAPPLSGPEDRPWPAMANLTHAMMLSDATGYLSDDILVKVDRAAMAVSLETRVPFLDHRVYEFAWKLPVHMKVRHGQGKWPRRLLYRYVPRFLVDRPRPASRCRWMHGCADLYVIGPSACYKRTECTLRAI